MTTRPASPVATLDLDHKGNPYRTKNCTGQGEHKFSTGVRVDFNGRVYTVQVYQLRPDHAGINKMETTVYLNGRMLPEGQRRNVRLAALDAYNDAFLSAENVRAAREAFDNPAPVKAAAKPAPVKVAGTIDMTPTWEETAAMLATILERGNPEGRAHALKELQRMGRLADVAMIVMGGHRRDDAPAPIAPADLLGRVVTLIQTAKGDDLAAAMLNRLVEVARHAELLRQTT